MNQILSALLGALAKDKGRDVNRTLVLVGVAWCAWQLTILDKRVAVIEAAHAPRIHHGAEAPTGTNHFTALP